MNNIFVLCRYDRETHDTELVYAFSNEKDAEDTCEKYIVSQTDESVYYVAEVAID